MTAAIILNWVLYLLSWHDIQNTRYPCNGIYNRQGRNGQTVNIERICRTVMGKGVEDNVSPAMRGVKEFKGGMKKCSDA